MGLDHNAYARDPRIERDEEDEDEEDESKKGGVSKAKGYQAKEYKKSYS